MNIKYYYVVVAVKAINNPDTWKEKLRRIKQSNC